MHPVNTQSTNKNHRKLHFNVISTLRLSFPPPYQSSPNKTFKMKTYIATTPFSLLLSTEKYNNTLLVIHFKASKYVHHTKNYPNYSPSISQITLANQIIY